MKIYENLLITLSEECTEVLETMINPSSVEDFNLEINDLIAVSELLEQYKVFNILPLINLELTSNQLQIELLKLQYFISKSLRFGLKDNHPDTGINNETEILKVLQIIKSASIESLNTDRIEKKKTKVLKYLNYSISINIVEENKQGKRC
jgi:hypothetical protein